MILLTCTKSTHADDKKLNEFVENIYADD